ncbi:MAG: Rieske (2Fe-2S) protein [Methanomassiliicoccales archaeon]|jgi:nitrite reductase/ring-hydroxylating ferredoxin subunit
MTKAKIGRQTDFPPGKLCGIDVNGKMVLVVTVDGKLCAVDGICTHMGGHLWEGKLIGNVVKCPRHGSEFDLRTGKVMKGPWVPFGKAHDLNSYQVGIEGDDVVIEMP